MVSFLNFFDTFDLDFLILAIEFYQCGSLEIKLCEKLLNKSQRVYFSILQQLENSSVDIFKDFQAEKMKALHQKKQEELDTLIQRLSAVEVRQKTTFAIINKYLTRH